MAHIASYASTSSVASASTKSASSSSLTSSHSSQRASAHSFSPSRLSGASTERNSDADSQRALSPAGEERKSIEGGSGLTRQDSKRLSSRFSPDWHDTRASCNLPEVVPEQGPMVIDTPAKTPDNKNLTQRPANKAGASYATMRTIEDDGLPQVVTTDESSTSTPQTSSAPHSASWRTSATLQGPPPGPAFMQSQQSLAPPPPTQHYRPTKVESQYQAPSPLMGGYRNSGTETVTPLDLLGDQPDMIDCPFCMRRSETRVQHGPSGKTHLWGLSCLFPFIIGAAIPYLMHWSYSTEHWCANCDHKVMKKVASLRKGQSTLETYGTPLEKREKSKYAPA